MNVTFVVDSHYINQLLFVLHRCTKHATKSHEYYVFFEDLEESLERKIKSVSNTLGSSVHLIKCTNLGEIFANKHLPKSTFLRLIVPEHLHETYMHLDLDTLPMMGWDSIELHMPSLREVISALRMPLLHKDPFTEDNQAVQRMGSHYFQAGVYLMNPNAWRERVGNEKLLKIASNYATLGFQFSDQDILNFVLPKSYRRLPENFNTCPNQFNPKVSRIVHFSGPRKPWDINYLNFLSSSLRQIASVTFHLSLVKKGKLLSVFFSLKKNFFLHSKELHSVLLYKFLFWKFKTLTIKFIGR